jgi:hypothetical protein
MRTVREKVKSTEGLYNIGARCLFAPSGGAVPVLVLQYAANGRQETLEIPLR